MKTRAKALVGVSMRAALALILPQNYYIGQPKHRRERTINDEPNLSRQQKRKLARNNEKKHR